MKAILECKLLIVVIWMLTGLSSHAADASVTIPWEGGQGTFTTNIYFYTSTVGETKTLHVSPENCYRFTSEPGTLPNGLTVVLTGYTAHQALYSITIIGTNKQGSVQISGAIEPECGGGGGGGDLPQRPFDISVLQKLAWIYFTQPANGTNLVLYAGTTNTVTAKVVLGDATAPSSGTVNFTSGLGTFTSNNIALNAGGSASTGFASSPNGGNGTITATASNLKDANNISVPSVARNLAVIAAKASVQEISFTGDHQLYENSSDHDGWGVGDAINDPVWTSSGTNKPVCYSKSNTLKMTVKLAINPEVPADQPIAGTLVADGPSAASGDFDGTASVSLSGTNVTGNITTVGLTSNMVYQTTPGFAWKFVTSGVTNVIGSSSHTVYVTYAAPSPASDATIKRIDYLVDVANGLNDQSAIADAIYDDFESPPPAFDLFADSPDSLWYLMDSDGHEGQCIDLAELMKAAYELLGCTGASIGYVYGSSDTNCFSTSNSAFETRTCPGGVHGAEAIFVYAAGGWNNWEAVCVVAGKYYGVQVSESATPVGVLRDWLGSNQTNANYQAWKDIDGNVCTSPGPLPVPKP